MRRRGTREESAEPASREIVRRFTSRASRIVTPRDCGAVKTGIRGRGEEPLPREAAPRVTRVDLRGSISKTPFARAAHVVNGTKKGRRV